MRKQWINIFKFQHTTRQLSKDKQIDLLLNLNKLLAFGFTLYDSFQFLNLQYDYKNKNLPNNILQQISNGATCHDILKLLGFNNAVLMQVYLAERYGNLIDTLEEIANYLQTNRASEQQFIKTLQYPFILISIFLGMIILLNHTIIPQFQQLFNLMNVKLSSFQQLLLAVITALPSMILYFTSLLILILIAIKLIYQQFSVHRKIQFITKIPILSSYYKLLKTYYITNELCLFLKNGINLQSIVDVYINHNNDKFRQYLGEFILVQSEKGLTLPQIISKLPCFNKLLIKFINQGEKRGKLDIELKLYSQILIKQLQLKMHKDIKIIQPIIFLFLAVFIMAIYLVIMLPMFQMMQNIN
ncbi:competence type IV pilus assembly protein ComGB [Staphylococcus simiae]|uniref:DNA transport machinery protein comGB n=1 Tax=Staphylococcus simiae CCM 7213 = CCUG 51256 TaxID=911238 RepID=G5JJI2_9STAP|nr:competence type IV pilus assembly protein ComGB [Staphylococcus simiae]EHJ07660.1 DNA transport machinery protein comGB [Staphylococcus simiae CCM 7213 = CCUG 51256]PNZ12412.1 type II secretion system F family protein [Staphylococcus simiae]SNV72894.1 ComG operon protein 2 [Staphylococcus simiae]